MRKLTSVAIVLSSIVASWALLSPPSRAQGTAPIWSAGDYWDYVGAGSLGGDPANISMKIEVVGSAQLSVGSASYDTYHCLQWANVTGSRQSLQVGGNSVYYRTSDLAIVQWGSRGPQNYYITFDPPLEWFRFPLLDRQNWSAMTDATFYNGMNRSNTTGNFRFLISGPETLVLPAGTFHTMGVQRQRVPWPDVISTAYYSDEVGFAARFSNVSLTNDQYYRGYGIPSVVDLREHHHASSQPFGLLTIVLVAGTGVTAGIGVVATFLYKRRRNRTQAPRETPVHSLPVRRPPP